MVLSVSHEDSLCHVAWSKSGLKFQPIWVRISTMLFCRRLFARDGILFAMFVAGGSPY